MGIAIPTVNQVNFLYTNSKTMYSKECGTYLHLPRDTFNKGTMWKQLEAELSLFKLNITITWDVNDLEILKEAKNIWRCDDYPWDKYNGNVRIRTYEPKHCKLTPLLHIRDGWNTYDIFCYETRCFSELIKNMRKLIQLPQSDSGNGYKKKNNVLVINRKCDGKQDVMGSHHLLCGDVDDDKHVLKKIADKAKTLGFNVTLIDFDKTIPMIDQIHYIRSTNIIIATHGSSLTHIVWANPNITVIEITPYLRMDRLRNVYAKISYYSTRNGWPINLYHYYPSNWVNSTSSQKCIEDIKVQSNSSQLTKQYQTAVKWSCFDINNLMMALQVVRSNSNNTGLGLGLTNNGELDWIGLEKRVMFGKQKAAVAATTTNSNRNRNRNRNRPLKKKPTATRHTSHNLTTE